LADPAPWQCAFGGAALTPAEFGLLSRLSRRRTVPAGESVFTDHLQAHDLVLLLSGDAVLGTRDSTGALRTERSVAGPAWLDASSAWLEQPYAMECLALSDILVAELPLRLVLAELTVQPQLAHRLCTMLARQVHALTVASRNLLHNDAPARFAQWLLYRCPEDADECEIRLQERKRDIAQQLAMTPETLSRLMRSFESRGLISVRGYSVRVHRVPALRELLEPAAT
jgi:CRP-like cAMP-binding protein